MKNTPASFSQRRPRFLLLDLLRLVAAVAVMLYHFTARENNQWNVAPAENFQFVSHVTAYGYIGVHLFFVISGFVILLSAEGRTVGQFVSARVSRLYPAYWAGVLATATLLAVAPQLGRDVTFPEFLINLTMLQEAFGVRHIDGVYWTLWIELLFYILIAILVANRLDESKVYWFAFLWPLTAAIAKTSDSGFLAKFLSPGYAPLFAGGMLIYLIYSRGSNLLRWGLLSMNICLAIYQGVVGDLLGSVQENTGIRVSVLVGSLLVLCIFGSVALVTLTPLKFVGWKWMTFAGALTYPVYLVHEYFGWWVIGLVNPFAGKWAAVAAAFFVSFLLAVAIERWVERPLRPRIRTGLQSSFDSIHAK